MLPELTSEKQTKNKFIVLVTITSLVTQKESELTVSVTFLRQERQTNDIFVFSEVPELGQVVKDEILRKLKQNCIDAEKFKFYN